ncbi:MAG: tryptophan synthase subunit alpha [Ruminococcaceae bacterium]|nr:tryptophan synthase subunit alpha [Oscillospiraceae bacterium]
MSNIKSAFKNGKALIAFITCGDPDLETTAALMRAAVENGASMIELGIPFSDPTVEETVVQESSIRALRGGATTDAIFDFLRAHRHDVDVPVVLYTYANVMFSYGMERFAAACSEVGVDGILITDIPFEERDEFHPACKKYGVDLIPLIAPASDERIAAIAADAEGFLYAVSNPGESGVRGGFTVVLEKFTEIVRRTTDVPCVVSASDLGEVKRLSPAAGGIVVIEGTAALLEKYGKDAPAYVGEYLAQVRRTMDEA